MSTSRDLSGPNPNLDPSSESLPTSNVQFTIDEDSTQARGAEGSRTPRPELTHTFQSDDSEPALGVPGSNPAPVLRNRRSRALTNWGTFPAVTANPSRPSWQPGQEPGLDPSKPNGGREGDVPGLHARCDITVVEYSEDDMHMRRLNNETLPGWIAREEQRGRQDWVKCTWICVNGLSWDVIGALGRFKRLHRLALEDLVNTKNRTKADWYSDHAYIVLTLQKLVQIPSDSDDEGSDVDDDSVTSSKKRKSKIRKVASKLRNWFSGEHRRSKPCAEDLGLPESRNGIINEHNGRAKPPLMAPRTLQRYHGGHNVERMAYMESHSAMTRKGLAVCAEQVSIFLANDNTVISFFESSAEDIETPILKRISTPETILRRSCDASLLTQAIIDAIIDLAMPVATTYQDIIGELEVDVLTEPTIKHTRELYILTSEVTTMRNFISPIASLVRTMREHKSEPMSGGAALPEKTLDARTEVKISSMARTYLGDVEDHCILIMQELDQMNAAAGGMIDLIFNTISAYQNETMKQLTTATIIFLPLTFMTGYFGMNLHTFDSLDNGEGYFWSIATPVAVGTTVLLMWEMMLRWAGKKVQRRGIMKRRRWREREEEEIRGKRR